MRLVIQKVKEARVIVDEHCVGAIESGLMILVGIEAGDGEADIQKGADKVAKMRIFSDEEGKMNRSIIDEKGSILSVSQFTLAGDSRKGNRPSFVGAMEPIQAKALFELFNQSLQASGIPVETGVFQAHMNVVLNNDGPVTIILDVKDGKVV